MRPMPQACQTCHTWCCILHEARYAIWTSPEVNTRRTVLQRLNIRDTSIGTSHWVEHRGVDIARIRYPRNTVAPVVSRLRGCTSLSSRCLTQNILEPLLAVS